MPQNSNFRPKFDFTFIAPNHGGYHPGSIFGPMGSHWDQKMGQNRKKWPCPEFEFSTIPRSSISAKIRLYRYGAKSRWAPPRFHLGANGFHWVKKLVKTVKNYHAPKFEFSTTLRSSISTKIWLYRYGAKSPGGPPRVSLGANGIPLSKKNGSKP